jgi:hypothetical protein
MIKQLWNLGVRDRQALACIAKMLKSEIDGMFLKIYDPMGHSTRINEILTT